MEYSDFKKIIKDMEESKLTELEIEFPDGTKIKLKKDNQTYMPNVVAPSMIAEPMQMVMAGNVKPTVIKEENKSLIKTEENLKVIKSPMVGTFYEKPAPNAKCYVEIGQKVKKGDILCIIEAMKLMNEIESEFDGEIVEILVKDRRNCGLWKTTFQNKIK